MTHAARVEAAHRREDFAALLADFDRHCGEVGHTSDSHEGKTRCLIRECEWVRELVIGVARNPYEPRAIRLAEIVDVIDRHCPSIGEHSKTNFDGAWEDVGDLYSGFDSYFREEQIEDEKVIPPGGRVTRRRPPAE